MLDALDNHLGYNLTQQELSQLLGVSPQAIHLAMKKAGNEGVKVRNKTAYSSNTVRNFLQSRSVVYPNLVIAFQMLKGGSTKTSTAFNLAIRLHQYGARVLCIDADPQGNLTDSFGFDVTDEPVLYNIAKGDANIHDCIININEGLDIIPSDFDNSALDFELTSKMRNVSSFFANTIAPVRNNYDFVIIDCNPSLSPLNISIALSADRVIIPVNPDKYSRKGLDKTVKELERMSTEYNQEIKYQLVFTLFDGREAISQKYLIEYGTTYKDRLISTVIRRSADVKNAVDAKKSIFEYTKAAVREDFDLVARDILGIRDLGKEK